MGSRVRVSSGPPTKEKRGFDIFETSFVFLLFHLQKKYDYLLLVVSEDRLTIDNLSPFTVNYAKSPNDFMPNHRIFKLLLTFADANTLKSSICTYNATLPIVYCSDCSFYLPKAVSFAVFAFDNAFFGKIDCNGLDCSFRFAYVCGDFFLCCFLSFLQDVQHCNLFQTAIQSAKFAL